MRTFWIILLAFNALYKDVGRYMHCWYCDVKILYVIFLIVRLLLVEYILAGIMPDSLRPEL